MDSGIRYNDSSTASYRRAYIIINLILQVLTGFGLSITVAVTARHGATIRLKLYSIV